MLDKKSIQIPFAMGIDRKSDPWQIKLGNFYTLNNSVFTKAGRLTKRNGYKELTTLSGSNVSLSTFNDGLNAIGTSIQAFADGLQSWTDKGTYVPCNVSVKSLIHSAANQTQCDVVVASNGLSCVVYTETASGSSAYKYAVFDSAGACLVNPTAITPSAGTVTGSPRVFALGRYFIIVFTATITAADHLQYIAVPINMPANPGSAVNITSSYNKATTVAWDGIVVNESLYLAWNTSGSAGISMLYLTATLTLVSAVVVDGSHQCTMMSLTSDMTNPAAPIIWASYYNLSTTAGYTLAVNTAMSSVLAATQIIAAGTILNITSSAQNRINQIYWEVSNNYSWDSIPSNFIQENTVTQAGVVGTPVNLMRGLGLASKSWIIDGTVYVLGVFSSPNQKTYFIVQQTSRSASPSGKMIGKLAYSNSGGYLTLGLPSAIVTDTHATIGYLRADLLVPTNTTQGATVSSAVYAQTGIFSSTLEFDTKPTTAEIGGSLHISGGQLWMYDGTQVVEHGFHLWPDSVKVTTATGAGLITAGDYYYQALYEFTDAAGNIHRSAPSIPVLITTTTTTSTNTIKIPTLRQTLKTTVKIILYRWTAANPVYYQVTSITSPTLNDATADSVTITDALATSSIIGNSIIYTTGGVVENIGAPATNIVSLYNGRLFLVDAEDSNLLWFSKQVIEAVPVEMSDLFTIFVSPTLGAQGNTGPISALAAMDSNLMVFKPNAAIYYISGTGPDNTGSNNDFSQPTFVASTVGCDNPNSLTLMPLGLMFQSDKGIWLLGRDLSTSYIGAQVEDFNEETVLNALTIPGTNQVRFMMSSGTILMYDYYFQQWGTFTGVRAISSTLFEGMHTILDAYGRVLQELPGSYLDATVPVLINFILPWINLAGLQGFERAYFFYLLGQYITPHTLEVSIAYDYSSSPTQSVTITPDNYAGVYGSDPLYGDSDTYGGPGNVEQWRVFFERQQCQAFQISVQENFDASFGTIPGAGLTLSGINPVIGIKKGYPVLKPSRSVG